MPFPTTICYDNVARTIKASISSEGMVTLKNDDSSLYIKYDLVTKITEESTPQFSVITLDLFQDTGQPDQLILSGAIEESLAPAIGEKIYNILGIRKGMGIAMGKFWVEIE